MTRKIGANIQESNCKIRNYEPNTTYPNYTCGNLKRFPLSKTKANSVNPTATDLFPPLSNTNVNSVNSATTDLE